MNKLKQINKKWGTVKMDNKQIASQPDRQSDRFNRYTSIPYLSKEDFVLLCLVQGME